MAHFLGIFYESQIGIQHQIHVDMVATFLFFPVVIEEKLSDIQLRYRKENRDWAIGSSANDDGPPQRLQRVFHCYLL